MIKNCIKFILISVIIFTINLFIQREIKTDLLVPMFSILGVFLVAYATQGFTFGILSTIINVIVYNYAFREPYYAISFSVEESIYATIAMIIVATMTSYLTSRIKEHEKIKAEIENEKLRANLLRSVSHDLRTPLTSIYGSTSTVIENYDSLSKDQVLQLLNNVKSDSNWLVRMVENLLSITKVSDSKVQINKIPVPIEELVDITVTKFKRNNSNIDLKVFIPEEFISVDIDPLLIEQVLQNLLSNAVQHAKGMTKLELYINKLGSNVIFDVIDDGIGINENEINKMLAGNYMNSNFSDAKRGSIGIGLSVCASIVKAHGGSISAHNMPSGGSCFSFTLRLGDEQGEKQQI